MNFLPSVVHSVSLAFWKLYLKKELDEEWLFRLVCAFTLLVLPSYFQTVEGMLVKTCFKITKEKQHWLL